jgi:pyruvate dehydrogenase complex dehydrogenase (E1) component
MTLTCQEVSQLQPIFFLISKYNVIRIKRSREWFAAVKKDIKSDWDLIMKLQGNPEDFEKYKESIHLIKNKKFLEKWHSTTCLIADDASEQLAIVCDEYENEDMYDVGCMINTSE